MYILNQSHEYDIFQKIINLKYTFPDGFSELAQDLIKKLIIAEPNDRLGATDYSQLKSHEFFKSVDWTSSLVNSLPPCDS